MLNLPTCDSSSSSVHCSRSSSAVQLLSMLLIAISPNTHSHSRLVHRSREVTSCRQQHINLPASRSSRSHHCSAKDHHGCTERVCRKLKSMKSHHTPCFRILVCQVFAVGRVFVVGRGTAAVGTHSGSFFGCDQSIPSVLRNNQNVLCFSTTMCSRTWAHDRNILHHVQAHLNALIKTFSVFQPPCASALGCMGT